MCQELPQWIKSAFNLISRNAMLQGFAEMPGGLEVLPCVQMFYGSPYRFLWDSGTCTTANTETPLMPLLFSLGQHRAQVSGARELRRCETYVRFSRRPLCDSAAGPCGEHPSNTGSASVGKNHVAPRQDGHLEQRWNPPARLPCSGNRCHARGPHRNRVAREPDFGATPPREGVGGSRVHNSPKRPAAQTQEHGILLDRITAVGDLQSAWCILLHCAFFGCGQCDPQWRVCEHDATHDSPRTPNVHI